MKGPPHAQWAVRQDGPYGVTISVAALAASW
jgi:hypothetical protein